MINIRMRQIAREVALTLGATLGVLCIAAAVATPLLGIRLLVFQSGSMSPTIETGGIALARTVDAADLARGDIVSVTSSEGTRVTHRITDVAHNGNQAGLTLRGDANASADRQTYHVASADRVFWHANGLGYLIRAFSSPYVIFIAGGAAIGLIMLAFRRPRDDEDTDDSISSRTKIISAAAAVVVLGGAGLTTGLSRGVVPTLASFTDTAEVDGDFATMTVPKPAASLIATDDDDVDCTNGTWLSGVLWVGWTKISNPPANYRYQVDVYLDDPTRPDVTYTVTDKMATIGRGDLTHGAGTYHAKVYGSIDGTNWRSIDSLERTIEVGSGGLDIRCSDPYTTRAKAKSTDRPADEQKKAEPATTQNSSAPDSPAPEKTAPEKTAPEKTAPEKTASESSGPESPAVETSTPEPSASESSAPETDASECTKPENPATETPTPEKTTPEKTAPEKTAPDKPTGECSVPETIAETSTPESADPSTPPSSTK